MQGTMVKGVGYATSAEMACIRYHGTTVSIDQPNMPSLAYSRSVFGEPFRTLSGNEESQEGIRLLGRAARRNYTVAAMPSLVSLKVERWLPPLRRLYQDRNKYLAFGKKRVMARTKKTTSADGSDIFSFLLHAKDPATGDGISMSDLWMEGNTLIVAGSDTTSTKAIPCFS